MEAHSRTTRSSRLPNIGTVGIIFLFKFRIAVGIRTVCGAKILVSSEGGHSEQITSRIPLKLHCQCCPSMLFEELFRNISFLHRFLASEIHSCEEVGVLIRRMLLLELVVVLPCLWMSTCALEIRRNF